LKIQNKILFGIFKIKYYLAHHWVHTEELKLNSVNSGVLAVYRYLTLYWSSWKWCHFFGPPCIFTAVIFIKSIFYGVGDWFLIVLKIIVVKVRFRVNVRISNVSSRCCIRWPCRYSLSMAVGIIRPKNPPKSSIFPRLAIFGKNPNPIPNT